MLATKKKIFKLKEIEDRRVFRSPGRGTLLCSWARQFTLTVPLSTQCVQMGTSELNAVGNAAMDYHPIQGGVEILLDVSYYTNRDKLRPDGSLGSYSDREASVA